ncbi:MAG TPA: organomercurial lyase [Actinomycetota bacterium]|nr:organomercurial lyase [Actinomycetota bacterium]
MTADLDRRVRLHLYQRFADEGRPPTHQQVAEAIGEEHEAVAGAFRRLAEGRVIVLEPDTLDVWMANPFSARPTGFRVEAGDRWWWGTCAWDAPGILAMLGADGAVRTACPDCDEPLELRVEDGSLLPLDAVAHFAVPARRWWEDIGFT